MLLVTGFSENGDGIAYLANTDDPAEAFRMLLEQWNSTGDDMMKLVTANAGGDPEYEQTHLVRITESDDDVRETIEEYGDAPGWQLNADPVEPGKITLNMPW